MNVVMSLYSKPILMIPDTSYEEVHFFCFLATMIHHYKEENHYLHEVKLCTIILSRDEPKKNVPILLYLHLKCYTGVEKRNPACSMRTRT